MSRPGLACDLERCSPLPEPFNEVSRDSFALKREIDIVLGSFTKMNIVASLLQRSIACTSIHPGCYTRDFLLLVILCLGACV